MHKFWGAVIVAIFSVGCFYFFTPVFSCEEQDKKCESVSNVQADSRFGEMTDTVDENVEIRDQAVSERLLQQKEILRQKESELEDEKNYQKQLLEEWKVIVAEYEAERLKEK